MAPDTSDRKATKPSQGVAPPPPEAEHLPCPRCDSTNTKFCYYNNYNFSQPRHFCKSCRRYWTHGGTLRDIPVGGGSRKNAKRSRTTATTAANPTAASGHTEFRHFPVPMSADHGMMCGSFTSLLSNTHGSNGLLGLGGFGLGIGNGLEDMGFGLGRAVWPFTGVVEGGPTGGSGMVGHTWQVENGESGFVGNGDCFAWPDLAISTPGSILK